MYLKLGRVLACLSSYKRPFGDPLPSEPGPEAFCDSAFLCTLYPPTLLASSRARGPFPFAGTLVSSPARP